MSCWSWFYQTWSAWSMDQSSSVYTFALTVTKSCDMFHVTKLCNIPAPLPWVCSQNLGRLVDRSAVSVREEVGMGHLVSKQIQKIGCWTHYSEQISLPLRLISLVGHVLKPIFPPPLVSPFDCVNTIITYYSQYSLQGYPLKLLKSSILTFRS